MNSTLGSVVPLAMFNRLLGKGWSDLDDFFRPPWNFDSDGMLKNSPVACLREFRITPIADFGLFWPRLTSFFLAHFFPLSATTSHVQQSNNNARRTFELPTITPKFGLKCDIVGQKSGPKLFGNFRQKADQTSGQNILNQNKQIAKISFILLELQEWKVQICVQPNFPHYNSDTGNSLS